MWFEKESSGKGNKSVFVSMPGVPFEMKAILFNEVIPLLKKQFSPVSVLHSTFQTQGVGESFLSDILEPWELALPSNLKLAYLPQPGIVRLRLTGTSNNEQSLKKQMEPELEKLKKLIRDYLFGEGETTLEAEIGRILKAKNKTLATAESCTGGYIAHLITSIPGSSAYFKGSIVAYSNEVKMKELKVVEATLLEHGAVSEEVVEQMAANIRTNLNTDYSIAISGIAGPDGGTIEKPIGTTWIAIAGPTGIKTGKFLFGDNRERNIRRAALQALNMLRKYILGQL
jgi:nicotinamide-nucleotide amidase